MRKLKGKLVCSSKISNEELAQITEKFEKLFYATIDFTIEIDPSLVGGFCAIIDNMVYDLSVKSYLQRMRHYMEEGSGLLDREQWERVMQSVKEDVNRAIETEDVGHTLADQVSAFNMPYDISMIGIVERTGDGVVFVRGLWLSSSAAISRPRRFLPRTSTSFPSWRASLKA